MQVDPSIVITLRSKWHVMQPTRGFCEGYLLPLAGILDRNRHIRCVFCPGQRVNPRSIDLTPPCRHKSQHSYRRMNLSGTGVTNVKPAPGNGDSNARVLHQVLASNTTIETLVNQHAVDGASKGGARAAAAT